MRSAVAEGLIDYVPPQCSTYPRLAEAGRTDRHHYDVFFCKLSPPDRDGLCSFGLGVGWSRTSVARSDVVVAQIDPSVPRTGGDNWVAIDDIDWLVESPDAPDAPIGRPSAWEPTESEASEPAVKSIAENWLGLIRDGDVLQFGAGKITFALPPWLASKRRLSIYTEICPAGALDLMRTGVVDGGTNSRHPGKLVAVSLAARADQVPWIDGNPQIELYEFGYVNNPANLSTIDNLVATNSCLRIDLFGQVNAESRDGHMIAGPGGQFDFVDRSHALIRWPEHPCLAVDRPRWGIDNRSRPRSWITNYGHSQLDRLRGDGVGHRKPDGKVRARTREGADLRRTS